jgi:hypothetical protein
MARVKRQARKIVRKALGVKRGRPSQVAVPGDNPAAQALNALIQPVPRLSEATKQRRAKRKLRRGKAVAGRRA